MAISSMTGFARTQGAMADYHWAWELRSVNGRNLDIRTRVPAGFELLEPSIRALVQKKLQRGSVSVALQCRRSGVAQTPVINEEALAKVLAVARKLEAEMALAPPSVDGILGLKGVIDVAESEEGEEVVESRNKALLKDLEAALDALANSRQAEGRELVAVLSRTLDDMAVKATAAAETAAAQPAAIKARFQARLEELLGGQSELDNDRLAQEVAMLAAKADVREELDRLATHIAAARALLAGDGAVGRRMDFLAQELNREANTMCAKSSDTTLTAIGLDIKTLIDQLREQVQNLE
jgi:uncharacterized protein (TIGR00255 family)